MNYKEIKEQIVSELDWEIRDSDENRDFYESMDVDVDNEIERYSALISAFETIIEKAQAYDQNKSKIEAYEDIVDAYERNTGLGEHDEDLTNFDSIVDSIELAIRMVGYYESEDESE